MDHVCVAESLTRAHISNIELPRQLDYDILPGDLSERSVLVGSDSVPPNDPRNGDVIFDQGKYLRIAEAVAGDLRLRQTLAISGQHFDCRSHARAAEQRINEGTVARAAKIL